MKIWNTSFVSIAKYSFILLICAHLSTGRPPYIEKVPSCGYESCPQGKPGFINVHLLAHTHDDVGWLKTVDQYYYGAENHIYRAGVQYILDNVIQELRVSPERRFIYVEVAFFQQWWQEQNDEMKNVVHRLVNEGRLEFINGGYCMNDEATTHYADIIDQMALGLNILNETFGECGRPRIAWQIDPFGHSREQASLFTQMGFDGLFFGRLDYEDKRQRKKEKTMEMIWSTNNSPDNDGMLFTGSLYTLYQPPVGFCFDTKCYAQPIMEDPKAKTFNVERRVSEFLKILEIQKKAYATDNILVTMGGDFSYQDANMWFKNMDKLIKYTNARQINGSLFNLFYSTPSCYLKSLNDLGRSWPLKKDSDFFPYGSDRHSYWTGYFTSRPALKYMVRFASNLLRSCKQMESALRQNGRFNQGDISVLKEAVAILQHHDGVSGTAKQHVTDDYARLLHMGVEECQRVQSSYYKSVLPLNQQPLPLVSYCQLNISQCEVSEKSTRFIVNVYNSLTRNVDKYVRIPVLDGVSYSVLDPEGFPIETQLVPIPEFVLSIPGRISKATYELVFLAAQLPPLGMKSYFIEKSSLSLKTTRSVNIYESRNEDITVSNDVIDVTVDGFKNLIKTVSVNGKVTPLEQEFLYYTGHAGFSILDRSSGAYIFRPNENEPSPMLYSPIITSVINGPLVQEIHQSYGLIVNQIIRLYKDQEHVELDWVIGSIPVQDGFGKEIISRVTTNIASQGIFYTDSNGRQTIKRQRNSRESYNFTLTEPVAANYYPINSHIYLNDNAGNQITLLVDRAQGGTSLNDGQIELMTHRRLLHDDWKGVFEPLNETAFGSGLVVRGTHYLIINGNEGSTQQTRSLGQELYRQPQISFIETSQSFNEWSKNYKTKEQAISRTLPENVNLMTFEAMKDGKFLIRLEHMYDYGEDPILSQPVTISLDGLFPGFTVVALQETLLGGNQYKSEFNRLPWNVDSMEHSAKNYAVNGVYDDKVRYSAIQLKPMEIRTFVMELGRV